MLIEYNKGNHDLDRNPTLVTEKKNWDSISNKYGNNLNRFYYIEFDTQKFNLKTYNNISKKGYSVSEKTYYETFFYNLRMILEEREKRLVEFLTKQREKKNFPTFFKDNEYIIHDKNVITNKCNSFLQILG